MLIRVIPNAKKFGIAIREGRIIVRIKAAARENAANKELLTELRELTGKKVHLQKGARARKKEIVFEGLADEDAMVLLRKEAE
ncbi:MAG: DUF167 domain-containing protein [Candidatus Micrarchaeota archaeon]